MAIYLLLDCDANIDSRPHSGSILRRQGDGRPIAADERSEQCRPGCELHPPCDDECKLYGCVKPAAPIGRWELDKTPTQAQLYAHLGYGMAPFLPGSPGAGPVSAGHSSRRAEMAALSYARGAMQWIR